MTRSRVPTILLLGTVALLALFFVLPAGADGPDRIALPWYENYDLDPSPCDFPVHVIDSGTITAIRWYEGLRHEKEIDVWSQVTGTFIGPYGRTLSRNMAGPGHIKVVSRNDDGTVWGSWVATGPGAMTVVPGIGPVYGSTGRTEYLLLYAADDTTLLDFQFVSSSGPVWDNPEALCAYLGGQ